jgi:hypothetical protein
MTLKEKYHRTLIALVELYTAADADGDARLCESANAAVVNLLRGLPTGDVEELAHEAREKFGHTIVGLGR